MAIEFIDKQWSKTFANLSVQAQRNALIMCPFISKITIKALLGEHPAKVKVLTRFNLNDLLIGVSEIEALEYLLETGAEVKGVKHLHSKVYVFGESIAMVTSANLTQAALYRNTEYGITTDEIEFVNTVKTYFDSLWDRSKITLTLLMLNSWKKKIADLELEGHGKSNKKLPDFGTDLGFDEKNDTDAFKTYAGVFPEQYFIKFFGTSGDRWPGNSPVIEEIEDTGSNLVLSYPKNKRPRQVQDGDLIFTSRLTENPSDIMIYGRCRGKKYVQTRDDVSTVDIKLRHWRSQWPHYIRVEQPEYVNSTLKNCVSFNDIKKELGVNTFVTTSAHSLSGKGNIDPQKAYSQQASARLTTQAAKAINEKLDEKFKKYGKVSPEKLASIK